MTAQLKALVPLRIRRLRPELVALIRRLRWSRFRLPAITLRDITGLSSAHHDPDPILDGICMPPFTGSSLDDFDALMTIVHTRQPGVVLELGTAQGNTVANICRQAPDARVYTVNAPAEKQSGTLTTFEWSAEQIGRVYRESGYGHRVTQILENTLQLDLGQYFPEPMLDLAIVDACHDTDYVVHDFLKVLPFIRPGGMILLHDTHPSMTRHYYSSYRACLMLRRRGHDIRHLEGTSWAVWFNGWPEIGK